MKDKIYIASNILFFRKKMKLNQDELATIVGCSPAHIGQLERNCISNPGYFLIQSLADYIGVNIEKFVYEDLSAINPIEQVLFRASNNLTLEELEPIVLIIEGITKKQVEKGYYRMSRKQISATK